MTSGHIHFWVLSFCVGGKCDKKQKRETDFSFSWNFAAFPRARSQRRISCLFFITIAFFFLFLFTRTLEGKSDSVSVPCHKHRKSETALNLLTETFAGGVFRIPDKESVGVCAKEPHDSLTFVIIFR